MIKKRGPVDEPNMDHDLRSPRISWSVLTMGAGVIASIVLNYAAYDTRITVLERAKLADESVITDLKRSVSTLRDSVHDLDVRVIGAERDIQNSKDRITRTVERLDNLDSQIDNLKKNAGK